MIHKLLATNISVLEITEINMEELLWTNCMDSQILYLVVLFWGIFSGKVRCPNDDLTDVSDMNFTICPQRCLEDGHSCKCYSDGWIDCDKRNFTTIPSLPVCARMIRLRNNQITGIEKPDFAKTIGAAIIDLSNNKITELRSSVFEHLTKLSVLILHQNSIVNIDDCAFYGLKELTSLDLSHNQITTLPNGVFDGNPSLHEISLYQNNISDLRKSWFQNKTRLDVVVLYKNPWNCSCQLWNSYQHIANHSNVRIDCDTHLDGVLSSMCIRCHSPSRLRNLTLWNLTVDFFGQCSQTRYEAADKLEECDLTTSAFSTKDEITTISHSIVSTSTPLTSTEDETTSTSVASTNGTAGAESHTVEIWVVALVISMGIIFFGLLVLVLLRYRTGNMKTMGNKSQPRGSTEFIISYQETHA